MLPRWNCDWRKEVTTGVFSSCRAGRSSTTIPITIDHSSFLLGLGTEAPEVHVMLTQDLYAD